MGKRGPQKKRPMIQDRHSLRLICCSLRYWLLLCWKKLLLRQKKAGGKGASLQRHPRQVFIQAFFSRMNMPVLVSSSTLSEGFLVTRLTRIIAATDRMKPYMLGCMGREMTLVNWA